jgi:uncharacterized protein (TIGR00299 family) protein
MSHLHFDCFSGISGDMILGALVDAGVPLGALRRELASLNAGRYQLQARRVRRAGLAATKVTVVIKAGLSAPLTLAEIRRRINSSRLPIEVKERGRGVFERLAEAEGIAHGVSAAQVRFHEVGAVDSLVDVLGGVLACHLLGVQRISASAVNLGSGMIKSAHGSLPVPGPAVAALARNLPVYSSGPARELTTPTGLALLRSLAQEFGPMPLMHVKAIGYGAGTADPADWPNVLRVFLGEPSASMDGAAQTVMQIETNLDDLNPQLYEVAVERLFEAGALDVTLVPVVMKRGRPGVMLTVLAPPEKAETVAKAMFRETTTLGVRIQAVSRWVLPRRQTVVATAGGMIRIKIAETGKGEIKAAPEFSDCKRAAARTGRPVRKIMEEAMLAYATRKTGKKSNVTSDKRRVTR